LKTIRNEDRNRFFEEWAAWRVDKIAPNRDNDWQDSQRKHWETRFQQLKDKNEEDNDQYKTIMNIINSSKKESC
jgi:hypothetical protein